MDARERMDAVERRAEQLAREGKKLGFVRPDQPKEEIVPDFGARFDEQAAEMVRQFGLPEEAFFRWPWASLDRMLGPLRPATVMIAASYTGAGKTTLGANFVARLIARDEGTRVYVMTAEESAADYLQRVAAIRAGYSVAHVMTNQWRKLPEDAGRTILRDVQSLRDRLVFAPDREVTPRSLARAMAEAQQACAAVVVCDHLNHNDQQYETTVGLAHAMREWVMQTGVPLLALAQMRRNENYPLAGHVPPRTSEIQGGEIIPQNADVVLGLYAPLKAKANRLKLLKREHDVRDWLEPGRVVVRCMKHRLDGSRRHQEAWLQYEAGRLIDPPGAVQESLADI